ncbi:MAG TPA: hypothetical protein VIL86_17220 [Tepidisphaeraceae bacterium]
MTDTSGDQADRDGRRAGGRDVPMAALEGIGRIVVYFGWLAIAAGIGFAIDRLAEPAILLIMGGGMWIVMGYASRVLARIAISVEVLAERRQG